MHGVVDANIAGENATRLAKRICAAALAGLGWCGLAVPLSFNIKTRSQKHLSYRHPRPLL